jgi:hypothetical protein
VTKNRTKGSTWVVTATVVNAGKGAATSKTSVTTVLAKGVTWSKVKAPRGWTCTKVKQTSTCSLSGSLAPSAKATFAYTVKGTPGKKRTVRITAATAGDSTATNNVAVATLPKKG